MRIVSILMAAALLSGGANATAATLHGPKDAAEAVLASEHAFAKRVAEAGIAQGFREFMDPTDGMAFGGVDPARGAEAIFRARGGDRPSNARLSWEPDEIFVAQGADMAVSWGHYSFSVANHPEMKPVKGRFVTVWRKDAKGDWKGLIDIGDPDA